MFVRAKRTLLLGFAASVALCADQAFAQFPGVTLQLPTIRTTQFNTVISVPDGGTASLGGNVRTGNAFTNRPGRGTTFSGSSGGGGAQVSAHVLIMSELEQQMLDNARPVIRQSKFNQQQINGSQQTQSIADFISGNINRR